MSYESKIRSLSNPTFSYSKGGGRRTSDLTRAERDKLWSERKRNRLLKNT
jgi:hypothetical protein